MRSFQHANALPQLPSQGNCGIEPAITNCSQKRPKESGLRID
jgi:hypothetical protein